MYVLTISNAEGCVDHDLRASSRGFAARTKPDLVSTLLQQRFKIMRRSTKDAKRYR